MEGVKKLARLQPGFSHSSATIQAQNAKFPGNNWRRGRDLNSRIGYPISGFQGHLMQVEVEAAPFEEPHRWRVQAM